MSSRGINRKSVVAGIIVLISFFQAMAPLPSHGQSEADELARISQYIATTWGSLTRSISCDSLADPKLTARPVLYLPAGYPIPASVQEMQKRCGTAVNRLTSIRRPGEARKLSSPGLLFLPNPYVVPGGRFNEMYGWDSYFIVLGLLRGNRLDLARGMVENFFFEIEHYGTVLNANRTYYLTRSQPPFLTSMVLVIYEAEKSAGKDDLPWLAKAYFYAEKDYKMWVRTPHLAGSTGLSRYYDFGEGPAPESVEGEAGYYRKVLEYLLHHPDLSPGYVATDADGSPALTAEYFKGDRAMRESGFDVSFRFGPYGAETHHYAPVCLNSLLYKTEKDLEHISVLLGRKEEAAHWRQRAERRANAIHKLLWDPVRGMFFDYNFTTQKRSTYEYATTFYPLWAGLATAEEAKAVVKHLALFEKSGGLAMSTRETGAQWDYPYGWAPIQLLAARGLRHYGYEPEANRVAYEFLSMVIDNFRRDGTIREKYNVVTRSSETQITAGYGANVIGFGWTNGVFLELLSRLPPEWIDRLRSPAVTSPPARPVALAPGRSGSLLPASLR